MHRFVFLFPGQGAQYVGMGRSFFDSFEEAREIFNHADDILQMALSKSIFEGPKETITQTKIAQPALFITSMAILAVLKKQLHIPSPVALAGLSLGEYSALTAAHTMTFETAVRLVNLRGSLMHEACEKTSGGMLALIGLSDDQVKELLSEINMPNDIWAANFNSPGQVVLSGTKKGLDAAMHFAKEKGARKAIPLSVHGAFHSDLMQSARAGLESSLSTLSVQTPSAPIAMNVTGTLTSNIEEIRNNLSLQVTSSVLWHQCIAACNTLSPTLFVEIGSGKTLAGLNKRIGVQMPTISIDTVDDLKLLEQML